MKSKMSRKHKAMAYVLKNMGYTMKNIGILMGVSPSTISRGISDFETERKIENLEFLLEEANSKLHELGCIEQEVLLSPNSVIDVEFSELD